MKCLSRVILSLLFLVFSASVSAEIFRDIVPFQSLGEIKKGLPNARFEAVKAAWVTKSDGFYRVVGQGLPGKLFLAFRDSRPGMVEEAAKATEALRAAEAPESSKSESEIKAARDFAQLLQSVVNESDDEALTISWIRWVPDSPIPLERYVSKYGKPDKAGFQDEDMRPYRSWDKRGVLVTLSDNEKNVLIVEFSFTKAEKLKECMKRFVPMACNAYRSK